MGSLTSVPKIKPARPSPAVYKIVQAPSTPSQPPSAPPPGVSSSSGVSGGSGEAEGGSSSGGGAAARADGLLGRSRGAFSTVLTGFRGLLSQAATQTPRKTLLGE